MAGVINAERIASLIDDAPVGALIGLTASDECVRAAAQLEIAYHVYRGLFPSPNCAAEQISLPW